MPDDHHPLMPRPDPERIDLGAIKADLEFLIERGERLTRQLNSGAASLAVASSVPGKTPSRQCYVLVPLFAYPLSDRTVYESQGNR